jgi:hypothetical protein
MTRCIYEIEYIPWIDNSDGKPWLYSGSDYYNNDSYLGSPSSTLKPEWTDGLTIAEWWRKEKRDHPENFRKNILVEVSDDITREELQSLESAIQKSEDHRGSNKYFNRTNKHFNSPYKESCLKGLSYEEIYGKERSKQIKQKRSETIREIRSQKTWNSNKNSKLSGLNKNKTYEEMYGLEKSKELKELRSRSSKEARKKDGHLLNKRLLNSGKHVSQKKLTCHHCGKVVDKANHTRWHGDNCKLKKDRT